MNTFKAPVGIWINPYSQHDARSLQSADSVTGLVIWSTDMDESAPEGYTKVGTGEITVTIASADVIVQGKVEALRKELEQDRADSQARQNAPIRKISELEALTYEAGVAA